MFAIGALGLEVRQKCKYEGSPMYDLESRVQRCWYRN